MVNGGGGQYEVRSQVRIFVNFLNHSKAMWETQIHDNSMITSWFFSSHKRGSVKVGSLTGPTIAPSSISSFKYWSMSPGNNKADL